MDAAQRQLIEIRILSGMITKTSREAMEKYLAEKGVSISMLQFGILHLVNHDITTSAELSRKMMLDPSTLVPSIDALVRKGYLRKERDPDDRRRYLLYVTDEIKTLLREMHAVSSDDPLIVALAKIGTEETELLHSLLRKVVENLPDGENMLKIMHSRLESIPKHNLD